MYYKCTIVECWFYWIYLDGPNPGDHSFKIDDVGRVQSPNVLAFARRKNDRAILGVDRVRHGRGKGAVLGNGRLFRRPKIDQIVQGNDQSRNVESLHEFVLGNPLQGKNQKRKKWKRVILWGRTNSPAKRIPERDVDPWPQRPWEWQPTSARRSHLPPPFRLRCASFNYCYH